MFRNLEAEQARLSLTNTEVAEILGMSRTTYETKKKTGKFNRIEIVRLLNLFNTDFEYLFETENNKAS